MTDLLVAEKRRRERREFYDLVNAAYTPEIAAQTLAINEQFPISDDFTEKESNEANAQEISDSGTDLEFAAGEKRESETPDKVDFQKLSPRIRRLSGCPQRGEEPRFRNRDLFGDMLMGFAPIADAIS